jgi:hypothetical protein
MVLGLLLFALPIGIIAQGFVSGLNRRRFAITWSTLKQQPLFDGFDVTAMTDLMECIKADIVPEHGQITLAGEPAQRDFSSSCRERRAPTATTRMYCAEGRRGDRPGGAAPSVRPTRKRSRRAQACA